MNILAGVHEQYQGKDRTTPTNTLKTYPKTAVTREFNPKPITPRNIVPNLIDLCDSVWRAGLVATVSFKFSVFEVTTGAWKPFIQSAISWLKDNNHIDDTLFVIWHEPENDIPSFFANAEHFVNYFNTVHDWIKEIAPDLLTVYAALGYKYNKFTNEEAKAWSGTKADIKAIDIYNGKTAHLTTPLADLPAFKRWYKNVVGGQGTYGITERGWSAEPSEYVQRAQAIEYESNWLVTDDIGKKCVLYIIWLTEGAENDPTLKPDPLMTAAVNSLLEKVSAQVETPQETIQCPVCKGSGKVSNEKTYVIIEGKGKGE